MPGLNSALSLADLADKYLLTERQNQVSLALMARMRNPGGDRPA